MTSPSLPSRYTVHSLLGEGGSGRVYKVQDSVRDRELALKVVTPAESSWLRSEFDTLRQIRHENLIQVFDWGSLESGEAYYTMELVEGEDWSRRMGRAQPPDEVRRILTGLLRGLAHLHCHAEIHGDLKPGNILLGRGGVVKVTDVGMGGSAGGASRLSGTPGYAAPETWEGSKMGVRSDIYSVGVMAYEALTGIHPFSGHTVREVISGQLEGWVPSPGTHGVRVPADLERVAMRAIERNTALRQSSADEFMEGMGVENRVGEILGGKFVGRGEELRAVRDLLLATKSNAPTLVRIAGSPGVGKSAFMEAVADSAQRAGVTILEMTYVGVQVAEAIDAGPPETDSTTRRATGDHDGPKRLTQVAERLWERAAHARYLVWSDAAEDSFPEQHNSILALARYLWALATERRRSPNVLFMVSSVVPPTAVEPFERRIQLTPFDPDDTPAQLKAFLGVIEGGATMMKRIHASTAGNPGLVRKVVSDLIHRGSLARLGGVWTLTEDGRLDLLESSSMTDALGDSWLRLGTALQRTLLQCALLPNGYASQAGSDADHGDPLWDALLALEARGWVRLREGHWHPASEPIRRMAIERSGDGLVRQVAAECIARLNGILNPEERGELALYVGTSETALDDGLESARLAMKRADFRVAIGRLRRALAIAKTLGTLGKAQEASLAIGNALYSLGQNLEARDALQRPEAWNSSLASDLMAIERELLLGRIARELGDAGAARTHFEKAIGTALAVGERSAWLTGCAELAEIDWDQGSESVRADAIARIRAALDSTREDNSLKEERAALVYGLGAALIRAGERVDAKGILLKGWTEECSPYWRMRIANAINSACHYLGEFEAALHWTDIAIRFADEAGVDALKPRILGNRGATLYSLGRLRESADQDFQAASWAKRLGNLYDFAGGLAGYAVNCLLLARYEEAIESAFEVGKATESIGDRRMQGKALELEALGHFYIGDMDRAARAASSAAEVLVELEYVDVRPRVDWARGKIYLENGDIGAGIELLEKAERALLVTRDLEDLWGVQIELSLARSREGDAHLHAQHIKQISLDARDKGILICEVTGSLAIAEILVGHGIDDGEYMSLLGGALARAEGAGMSEIAWRLSYCIGRLAQTRGDRKESGARYLHATRILREIAGRLTPEHRATYLESHHVRSAMKAMYLAG